MLPGFRFLFAAILLSMSILVFGLGAAALLRAAHEEFASNPSWRASPETMFAQHAEATRPVLAMLRIEPPAAAQKAQDGVAAPAEPAAIAPAPAEPEGIAALKPRETSVAEAAKREIPVRESWAQSEAAAAQADTLSVADTRIAAPDAETKVASTEQASPPAQIMSPVNEAAPVAAEPAASEPMSTKASPEIDAASTKIATLGGPPVIIGTPPPAKAVSEKPDRSAVNKRLQARRAAHRHRIAARARLAARQAQLQANPFAQALPQPPAVARR
jgi:hypothetical protein